MLYVNTHLNIHKRGFQQSPPTLQSQKSLTSFALLGHRHVDVGQSDISRLILDEQQADEGENHADHPRGCQDGPPAVGLGQHRGDDGAQAACQVHAAGQDGPPGPKLGGLEPLRRGLRAIEELMLKTVKNRADEMMPASPLSGDKHGALHQHTMRSGTFTSTQVDNSWNNSACDYLSKKTDIQISFPVWNV